MAENYEVGRTYYLPVKVYEVMDDTYTYPVRFEFEKGNGTTTANAIKNNPNLLLTADDIATTINTERAEIMESLGKQNLELSKQNEELSARVEELTDLTNYYIAERQRNNLNIRLLLDKIAELEGEKNG